MHDKKSHRFQYNKFLTCLSGFVSSTWILLLWRKWAPLSMGWTCCDHFFGCPNCWRWAIGCVVQRSFGDARQSFGWADRHCCRRCYWCRHFRCRPCWRDRREGQWGRPEPKGWTERWERLVSWVIEPME